MSASTPAGQALPPPPPIVTGTAGVSAATQYERRKTSASTDAREQPRTRRSKSNTQATEAWRTGAIGEERLGERLENDLADVAIVLHDRKVPRTRGNIDHLVVAPSGIWIVDAKNYTGKVERRHIGGLFTGEDRLYVNGRNQTKLVDGLGRQAQAVRAVLEPIGFGGAPVHPTLCFVSSSWGFRFKAIRINGATVTWPKDLVASIRKPGPLELPAINLLARELSSKLPASGVAVEHQRTS